MNTNSRRGFIPLVAIIAISIVVIAGGTAVTFSLTGDKKQEGPDISIVNTTNQETQGTTTNSTKEPFSSHTETLVKTKVQASPEISKTTQEDPNKPGVILEGQDKEICDTIAKQKIDTSKRSLAEDIRYLCERIPTGRYQGEELDRALETLQEKWRLWSIAQNEYQKREDRLEQDPRQ